MPTGSRTLRNKQLQTFAAACGSRPTDPASKRKARSFNLPEALVERAAAAMRGTQALTYGTPIAGDVPDSLTRLVQEAVEAACTFYEDQLNEGRPFPSATLSPGPGATGAKEGAAKRARDRAARADEADGAEPAEDRPVRPARRSRAHA